jgi:ankyrin repeat protein
LAATEFNQDDRYGELVQTGVKMKGEAFGEDEVFKTPGQWFSDNAHTARVSTLESIVKNSDARLWAHPKVVDSEGRSMLCVAAKVGNVGIFEKLVQVGADVKAADKAGRTPLLEAITAGSVAMCKGLIAARADVKAADKAGRTPLLEASGAGSVETCKYLIKAGADASAQDEQGRTPLLEASGAGNVEMCEDLIAARADVMAARYDGASPMAWAIFSHESEIAARLIPERMHSQDMSDLASYVQHVAQAFLQPANIDAWLRDGISPLALKGEAGALLTSDHIEAATKEQLGHVRAFLNHNEALLEKSPSEWPVAHTVLQLASQETGEVFADPHSALGDETSPAKRPPRLIHWLNKPNSHRCRLTMRARGEVRSVSYSKCGRKLARAEGNKVVVCDAETGFVESTLTGHSDW